MRVGNLENICLGNAAYRLVTARIVSHFQVGGLKNHPQCLKIAQKVAFNIASEASYVYILSGQKFIKNAKNGRFCRIFENLKLEVKQCYQTSHF